MDLKFTIFDHLILEIEKSNGKTWSSIMKGTWLPLQAYVWFLEMMMKKPIDGLHPIMGFKTCKLQQCWYLWWGLSPYPNTNPFISHDFLVIHLKHDSKTCSCFIFGLRETCWKKWQWFFAWKHSWKYCHGKVIPFWYKWIGFEYNSCFFLLSCKNNICEI